jgi:RNA polymerase sigma factor (sigma-70 family)
MSKRLTAQEEIDLSRRIQDNGDEEAFNQLVTANMGLVVFVVQKIPSWNLDSCLSRDDMVQEGNLALMRAARTWKPQNRFATYARKLIYSQVMRAIENTGQMIREPVPVQEKLRKLKRAESKLAQALGDEPTLQELAAFTQMPVDQIRELMLISQRQPISLDAYHRENSTEEVDYE